MLFFCSQSPYLRIPYALTTACSKMQRITASSHDVTAINLLMNSFRLACKWSINMLITARLHSGLLTTIEYFLLIQYSQEPIKPRSMQLLYRLFSNPCQIFNFLIWNVTCFYLLSTCLVFKHCIHIW